MSSYCRENKAKWIIVLVNYEKKIYNIIFSCDGINLQCLAIVDSIYFTQMEFTVIFFFFFFTIVYQFMDIWMVITYYVLL